MTRAIVLTMSLLAFMGVAHAQTPELDRARIAILEQELESVRLQALDAQRAAYAAQAQSRTEQNLQAMEAARAGVSASALLMPLTPLPYTGLPTSSASPSYSLGVAPSASSARAVLIDQKQAADSDRMLALQADAIARSNARVLAVRPAL